MKKDILNKINKHKNEKTFGRPQDDFSKKIKFSYLSFFNEQIFP